MAVKTSGTPLALSEVQTEFGGANPISLSEYYRGAGLVPSGPSQNAGIAASGTITLGSFYGSVRAFVYSPTISANTQNYNLKASAIAAGWDQATPLLATVTVNSGVYVGSSSSGAFAFDTGVTFPSGSSLALINNGTIIGAGGSGGNGGSGNVSGPGTPGYSGGTALRTQVAISVTNNGTIAGGGGGGGGGGIASGNDASINGGGGGGGAGYNGGPGGAPGRYVGAAAGGSGTLTSGGAGGGGNLSGGVGGGRGAAGAKGGSGQYQGGNGGAAGAATSGNANITWVATGTRTGALN